MSPPQRARGAYLLAKLPRLDADVRATIVKLVGDAATNVRETAVKAMKRIKIAAEDLDLLEPLLGQADEDLRRGVLSLMLSLKDADVLASAARLTSSKELPKRLAGLDLLTQMRDAGRCLNGGREIVEMYRSTRKELERDEQVYLDKLMLVDVAAVTLDDAAGLMDNTKRTPPRIPKDRAAKLVTPAALELIKCFDKLIDERCEEPVTVKSRYGADIQAQPLGSINSWIFPSLFENENQKPKIRPIDDLPLRQLWWDAWENRPKSARDRDGLEAIRATFLSILIEARRYLKLTGWRADMMKKLGGETPKAKYPGILHGIFQWLAFYKTETQFADFVLDGFETVLAALPADKLHERFKSQFYPSEGYQFRNQLGSFSGSTDTLKRLAESKGQWTVEHTKRHYGLLRWTDEPLGTRGLSVASKSKGQKGSATAEPSRSSGAG